MEKDEILGAIWLELSSYSSLSVLDKDYHIRVHRVGCLRYYAKISRSNDTLHYRLMTRASRHNKGRDVKQVGDKKVIHLGDPTAIEQLLNLFKQDLR